MTVERTEVEKLQLELAKAQARVGQLERQNELLRCKLKYVAAYGDLPVEKSV